MNLPEHDDIHLLAGAHALNALDDFERQRFEQHLPNCPSCQEDLASFANTVGALTTATAELPPPALRGAVLAAVDQTRQLSKTPREIHRGQRTARWAAVSAAAVVMLLLAALNVQQHRTNQRLADRIAITEAADARTAQLTATPGSAGTVRVTYSPSRGSGVLVADDLPPAPANRTYELWIIKAGTPEPSITFQTDSKHHAIVNLDTVPPPGSVLAITEEPRGGSLAPTTTPSHISTATV